MTERDTEGLDANQVEWRERFERAVAEVQASVPVEWSEEELQQRITQAIDTVRARKGGAASETVPLASLTAEQQAKLDRFRTSVAATRAHYAEMTPEEIAEEVRRAIEEARTRQHAGRR